MCEPTQCESKALTAASLVSVRRELGLEIALVIEIVLEIAI